LAVRVVAEFEVARQHRLAELFYVDPAPVVGLGGQDVVDRLLAPDEVAASGVAGGEGRKGGDELVGVLAVAQGGQPVPPAQPDGVGDEVVAAPPPRQTVPRDLGGECSVSLLYSASRPRYTGG